MEDKLIGIIFIVIGILIFVLSYLDKSSLIFNIGALIVSLLLVLAGIVSFFKKHE